VILIPLFATGVVDTGGKFASGINNTSGTGGKFGAGVVESGDKFFATFVVDTSGTPGLANISKLSKKFEMTLSCEPRKRRPTRCRQARRVDSAGPVSPTCF
jgi:hypothetical protein